MKNNLVALLVLASICFPTLKVIDSYSNYNSKLLVIDESINTFNIESFYKIEC